MAPSTHSHASGAQVALIVVATVLALALLCAPRAHAAALEIDLGTGEGQDFYICDAKVTNTYVTGCFNNNGDVFYTADWERDSMRVATHWRLADGTRRGLCISTLGPVWIPAQGWVGRRVACNKNLPEGKRVEIRAGRCDGTIHDCKTLDDYRDWTAWAATTV